MTEQYIERCRNCETWRLNLKQQNEIRSLKMRIAELQSELNGFKKERDIKC